MKKKPKNIVLIGMSGCGKTTVGKLLKDKMNLAYIDMDEYIVEKEGRTIPEIFSEGEQVFRAIETAAAQELSDLSGTIISTGGGIIKNPVNMDMLRKNSVIIFLDRSVEEIQRDIDVSGRPLLKNNVEALYKLYHERYELYKKYSDIIIPNNGEVETVLDKIAEIFSEIGG